MNSFEIRKKFFDFFSKEGHTIVQSSSLIPAQDPTLLFANAGMNQFKDVFLGKETRSYKKAVSIQKCIRAGGKHNDLDNVGFTRRHLTFFEMMGNFSFGDYFKKEAIRFAWNFLTNNLNLPENKLYASIYKLDDEAYEIWLKDINLPANRIVKLGEADNFWQMGDTGPCGPCSEIYMDRGSEFGCNTPNCGPGCACDRFLEIWNLVFMQFDRQPDGTDLPLKFKGVDTGMGLERLCSVIQKTDSVYETDLFAPLISQIEKLTKISYNSTTPDQKAAFRVLADHIRSSCFAIADGCTPSNEGRGYVLRKIIRRAALFAQKLSSKNIFPDLAPALIEFMSEIYPELKTNSKLMTSLLESEVKKFSTNLIQGQNIIEKYFEESKPKKTITGFQAFKLYDTYGFPLELTRIIAQEHGFSVDIEEFEKYMQEQRLRSGKKEAEEQIAIDETIFTHFTGYDEHITKSVIIGLIVDNQSVSEVKAATNCYVITKHSPFFVECGGQISDQGFIQIGNVKAKLITLKKINQAIAAYIEAPVDLYINEEVTLIVDAPTRIDTMKNHTATHLLQAALKEILNKSVRQSGSVVEPDYLRFDFTWDENLTLDQIKQVEDIVNTQIMKNIPVKTEITTYQDAIKRGVIAIFGEKYNPERVRIVEVPGFSAELCGGTHVNATGDIGPFKITEVSALSAGNRRIVALTGPKAVELLQNNFNIVKTLSQEYKVPAESVLESIKKQREQLKLEQNQVKLLKKEFYKSQIPEWLKKTEVIKNLPFLFLKLKDISNQELKDLVGDLEKKQPGFYFLASDLQDRSIFFASISKGFSKLVNFSELSSWLKSKGIQGGGKETLQGGAPKIFENFEKEIKDWIKNNILT